MSKIELTKNLITNLPKPENVSYVVCDSWYNCKTIFNSFVKTGYNYIEVLKTNKVIYLKKSFQNDCSLKIFISLDKSLILIYIF
ncbi:hypothetical protein [Clostridium sp. KNHs214]|uniref:hypothetical protein n=1 Tax=Clostridium sp. KNHs214 TaxID=1540257 RepID=UPI00163AC8C7|nr:hypothetical protein [Clostridium sp. KNHs214]